MNVYTPTELTSEEKKLLEKLRESPNFKPKPGAKTEKGFFDRMKDLFE